MSNRMDEIKAILNVSDLPAAQKEQVLLKAITALAPSAATVADGTSARAAFGDGTFLKILMDLLVTFLPILLELLKGDD